MDLDGSRILIVGASGGLGSALATALSAKGVRLALAGRDQAKLEGLGAGSAEVLTGDLREPAVPGDLVRQAADRLGGLDGVVYAAGVVAFGGVTDLDDDDIEELLLLNFLAPMRVIRAAFDTVERGGFIGSISAVNAEQPMAQLGAYSASKAAITAFTVAARLEGRKRDLRVMDIRPPHTETGLAERPIAGSKPKMPQGRTPAEVADRIVRAIADDEAELATSAFAR